MNKVVMAMVVICSMIFCSAPLADATTPAEMQEMAIDYVDLAREFTDRANDLLKAGITEQNLVVAKYLYMEGGKLFERAKSVYANLNKFAYVGKDYVDGADNAVKTCLDSVKQCNKRLAELKANKRRRRNL